MYEYISTAVGALLASYFTNVGLKDPKYKELKKPSWFPPGYLFGIAWTIIYILFAISWARSSSIPLINNLFIINLFLNVIWCAAFFYINYITVALFILISLNLVLIIQVTLLYKYDFTGSLMLVPYLLWSLFASFLNYTIISLN